MACSGRAISLSLIQGLFLAAVRAGRSCLALDAFEFVDLKEHCTFTQDVC
jgi:hypothetical protein